MKEIIRKVCVLGNPSVGKTSLVRRYVLDIFDDKYIPSIGMKATKKKIMLNDGAVSLTLMIWDILGSKTSRFDSVYYKGVEGALVVCDITRNETLESIPTWISGLFDVTGEVSIILLANKVDLQEKDEDVKDKLTQYASEYNGKFLFTSAKTGENVDNGFRYLSEMLI
jgi:small GTP-binding protein